VTRFIRIAIAAAALGVLAAPTFAQTAADEARFESAQRRFQNELNLFNSEYQRYQQARAANPPRRGPGRYDDRSYYDDDRYEEGYDASRYYRDDPRYQERVLAADDRVYRGSDGRYYCRRNDGTTGLIVGAVGGGLFGNAISSGHSRGVGTLLGAGLGALVGKSIDQNNSQIRCR